MAKTKRHDPDVLTLVLEEIRGLRSDMKEVKEDILPKIKTEVEIVKTASSNTAKLITGVGVLLSTATAAAMTYLRH